MWKRAAELGSIDAHTRIAGAHYYGEEVEEDVVKGIHHFQIAATRGHEIARHILGIIEEIENDNMDRANKHFLIAARSGFGKSLEKIGEGYKAGLVTKDEYASTLRMYQCSTDAMKSEGRTKATKLSDRKRNKESNYR